MDASIYFSTGIDLSVYCNSGVELFYGRSGLDVDSCVSRSSVFHVFAGVVGWIFIMIEILKEPTLLLKVMNSTDITEYTGTLR